MTDIKIVTLVLDAGAKRAARMGDPVLAAVLSDMTEAAVGYQAAADGDTTAAAIWKANDDWVALYHQIWG